MEKDFIDQLTTIPLTQRQYLAAGFEREVIHARIGSYYVRRRRTARQIQAKDPLLGAVLKYEMQYLQFGPLHFNGYVSKDDDYFQIGGFDDGTLCISRYDNTVKIVHNVHYPKSSYNTDYYCARSGSMFLDALIPAAIYLEKCFADSTLFEMHEMQEAMIKYCSERAGEGSSDFFKVLLEGPANGLFM